VPLLKHAVANTNKTKPSIPRVTLTDENARAMQEKSTAVITRRLTGQLPDRTAAEQELVKSSSHYLSAAEVSRLQDALKDFRPSFIPSQDAAHERRNQPGFSLGTSHGLDEGEEQSHVRRRVTGRFIASPAIAATIPARSNTSWSEPLRFPFVNHAAALARWQMGLELHFQLHSEGRRLSCRGG
jgi:hypothetical protein